MGERKKDRVITRGLIDPPIMIGRSKWNLTTFTRKFKRFGVCDIDKIYKTCSSEIYFLLVEVVFCSGIALVALDEL